MAKDIECGLHGAKVAHLAAQVIRDHQVTEAVQLTTSVEGFRASLVIEPLPAQDTLAESAISEEE